MFFGEVPAGRTDVRAAAFTGEGEAEATRGDDERMDAAKGPSFFGKDELSKIASTEGAKWNLHSHFSPLERELIT